MPKTKFWIEWSQILIWFHRITKECVQLCHPIALPLSRSLSLHRGGIRFFASAVAYKDIWVSIGYVQKHVVARALQAFALARAPRISNASVIHPLSNKKWPSHDMCLSKRRRIACHKRAVAAFTVHLWVWLNWFGPKRLYNRFLVNFLKG